MNDLKDMNELIFEILQQNKLTCPECSCRQYVEMAVEEQHIYECNACGEVVQANEDECCVYCQYGEIKCTHEQIRWN